MVVNEGLSDWIESVEGIVAANPELTGTIDEQRRDDNATQALRIVAIVLKCPEVVSVISIETELCPEPYEAPIVLDNLCNSLMRQPLRASETIEPDLATFDNGKVDYFSIPASALLRLREPDRRCLTAACHRELEHSGGQDHFPDSGPARHRDRLLLALKQAATRSSATVE
jgi:hypothetical protein